VNFYSLLVAVTTYEYILIYILAISSWPTDSDIYYRYFWFLLDKPAFSELLQIRPGPQSETSENCCSSELNMF